MLRVGQHVGRRAEVLEREQISFTCRASYSDGSVATVAAAWSEDSPQASMSADGVLSAGNVDSDVTVGVTASFSGFEAVRDVSVWMVGNQVVYPLSGFDGKTVMAELYVEQTGEWRDLGTSVSPDELVVEGVNPDQWYWVSVLESNETSGVWNKVHAAWLNL